MNLITSVYRFLCRAVLGITIENAKGCFLKRLTTEGRFVWKPILRRRHDV